MDATELLKKDHQEVTRLFQRFHDGSAGRGRRSLVDEICQELTVHMQIEEEIFYAALRDTRDRELSQMADDRLREHQRLKEQVEGLRSRPGGDEDGALESQVAALERDVERHLTEEEGRLFPRAHEVMEERSLSDLGNRLRERKRALTATQAGSRRARPSTARKPAPGRGRRAKTVQRRSKPAAAKSSGRKKVRGGRRGR
jgi:iron-sulfur cluster repair protein YtfE (RIC family)